MNKNKVVLIGLDGLVPGVVKEFRGDLPHTGRLIREGAFAHALPCMPTDTPTNWTTIATGADTLRHGVNGFAKGPDGRISAYFDSNRCKAEFVWETLERARRKAILVNYPTAWPLRTKTTTVVGGDGIFSPNWRIGDLIYYSTAVAAQKTKVALMDVCKTDVRIEIHPAAGWANAPASAKPALEAQIPSIERKAASWDGDGYVVNPTAEAPVSGHYWLLVTASSETGYDTVRVCRQKDAAAALCTLREGEWSGWIFHEFDTADGAVEGAFKFKLIELTADGSRIRLYRTMASRTDGWTQPADLAKELVREVGPYHEGWENSPMEMSQELGLDTLLEHAREQADWIAQTAGYLAAREEWDLLVAQVHIQDSYNHRFMWKLEPLCAGYDAMVAEETQQLFRNVYRITDDMIGRIVAECTEEDTTVIVVSDHGGFPMHTQVCVDAIVRTVGEDAGPDEIVQALVSVSDPRTGENPFALIARREDLPSFGLAATGPEVHYFFKAGYRQMPPPKDAEALERMIQKKTFFKPCAAATHHGLPSIRFKQFANAGAFLISGRRVAPLGEIPHPIHLKDVTPTICHLLDVAPPKQNEGRILWEVLV